MDWFWDFLEWVADWEDVGLFGIFTVMARWALRARAGKTEAEEMATQVKLIRKRGYLYRGFKELKRIHRIESPWRQDGSGKLNYIGELPKASRDEIEERRAFRYFLRKGYITEAGGTIEEHVQWFMFAADWGKPWAISMKTSTLENCRPILGSP